MGLNGSIPNATTGTKGDIAVIDATGRKRIVPLGSDNSVLTADSSVPTGVKWAAGGGGVPGIYTPDSYGARADGTTDDSTAINAAFAAAGAAGGIVAFKPGATYYFTAPLVWSTGIPKIQGNYATLKASATTYDLLTLGDVANARTGGYVERLYVRGPGGGTFAPATGKAAIVWAAVRHGRTIDCSADYVDIGFDLRANCYGHKFLQCRAGAAQTNVALLLRGGAGSTSGSGSDIHVDGFWGSGAKAFAWMEGNAGGYWFTACKVGGGHSTYAGSAKDCYGVFTVGPTYDAQTTVVGAVAAGATTIPVADGTKISGASVLIDEQEIPVTSVSGNNLTVPAGAVTAPIADGAGVQPVWGGVSSVSVFGGGIEGTTGVHAVRLYQDVTDFSFTDFSFNSNGTSGTNQMIQVLKHTRGGSPSMSFRRCSVLGQWTGAQPLTVTTTSSFSPQITEEGTAGAPGAGTKFNNVAMSWTRPMVSWSGIGGALAVGRYGVYHSGRMLRQGGTTGFQISTDATASAWSDIALAATPLVPTPTVVKTGSNTSDATGTTVAVSWAAPTSGNLLVAFVAWSIHLTARTITPPAGWSLVTSATSTSANNDALGVYTKVSDGTETSTTWTISANGDPWSVIQYEIAGQNVTTAIGGFGTRQIGTAATSIATPTVTPTSSGTLALVALTTDAGTTATLPGGWSVDANTAVPYHSLATGHATAAQTDQSLVSTTFTANSAQPYTAATVLIATASSASTAQSYVTSSYVTSALAGYTPPVIAAAIDTAALHELKGVSTPPANATGSGILTAGRLELVRVPVTPSTTITDIVLDVATPGSGAVVYAAVYSPDGATRLAVTGDLGQAGNVRATPGTTINGANNVLAPFTASFTAPAAGWVWVGLLGVSGTTQPTMRCSASAAPTSAINFGLINGGANGYRSGYTGSGLAALPATITPLGLTAVNRVYLIGLR